MDILKKRIHFKGSNFLIPMFLTSVVYTFYPDLLTIGAPFSVFLRRKRLFSSLQFSCWFQASRRILKISFCFKEYRSSLVG